MLASMPMNRHGVKDSGAFARIITAVIGGIGSSAHVFQMSTTQCYFTSLVLKHCRSRYLKDGLLEESCCKTSP